MAAAHADNRYICPASAIPSIVACYRLIYNEGMNAEERARRRSEAAYAYGLHTQRADGARLVTSLAGGLDVLRDLFLARVFSDVEQKWGRDSMLVPTSMLEGERRARRTIEQYLVVESTVLVRERSYVPAALDWYLPWLAAWRLEGGASEAQAAGLAERAAQAEPERRRTFTSQLDQVLPEAQHAPLVLFRLFPLAAGIVTAVAFCDPAEARDLRRQQMAILPEIGDCHECNGNVLDNGERCRRCGNPVWSYEWLTAN
ncbi:MAG: hypothetical protein K6T86_08305 [Pirellulales bacterium]|nr:hypothetical protein [Pirellulales bacterium]